MLKKISPKLKLIFIPCAENNYRPKFLESKFLIYYLICLLILKLMTIPLFVYLPRSIFFASLDKGTIIGFIPHQFMIYPAP
ncbi:MAG: hypothetical protein DDT19_02421 [Syntrophomonadaceae bacterium]|nr:hypothetical protein [Bacillota bacterium]